MTVRDVVHMRKRFFIQISSFRRIPRIVLQEVYRSLPAQCNWYSKTLPFTEGGLGRLKPEGEKSEKGE
jgi:hypothetical protein